MKRNKRVADTVDNNSGEKKPLRLNYPQTIKVGLAFSIIICFWTAYDFVVPLLLENAYGLSNMMRGLIMGLDNLLSLFLLPLFGRWSDKSKSKFSQKFGRRTPFIIVGTLMAVALMIFVPISSRAQYARSDEVRKSYETQLNDDNFMDARLNEFYNNSKYCEMTILKFNNIDKETYVNIRFDKNLVEKSGFLGIGGKSYSYNGVEVKDLNQKPEGNSKTYSQILKGNQDYKKYVKSGMNTWISEQVKSKALLEGDKPGVLSLSMYMLILLAVLICMATFRSPAVALMPDVTPKPLRSQGNAMINLMGGVGGGLAFLIYTCVLFNKNNYLNNFIIIFACIGIAMLVLLGVFLLLVKEKKLVDKCHKICEDYGITDEDEQKEEVARMQASVEEVDTKVVNESLADGAEISNVEVVVEQKDDNFGRPERKHIFFKKYHEKRKAEFAKLSYEEKVAKVEKSKKISMILLLGSIFMWFMGWNAITSNLSVYIVKYLNLSAGIASIVSGVSMAFSAVAFIPVGMMAAKIGRRKSVMIGFGIAIVALTLIFLPIVASAKMSAAKAAIFACFYMVAFFSLVIINVNTLPMVLEISKESEVGRFTGIYYVATMSAQAIAPFIAGAVMDRFGGNALFAYSAAAVAIALTLMAFVKYGDSMKLPKGKKMTKEEKKQLMLDSMDSPD